MSSRTNAGKKKVKRLQIDPVPLSNQPQVVRVEFTPSPLQVIELKSEKDKPQDESQQTSDPVELEGINWRIIGIFSALIPLIGTGILFMLGWAYEVSWYGFFGVNVNQVNTTPQNILIQSIPAIITFLTANVIATSAYYFFTLLINYFRQLIQGTRKKELLDHENEKSSKVLYNFRDWLLINLLTLVFMFVYLKLNYPSLNSGITQTYEIFYLFFFVGFSLVGLTASIILFAIIFVVLFSVTGIIFLMQKRIKKMIAKQPVFYKRPQAAFLMFVVFSVNVMTLLALSSTYGLNDAASGVRGSGGWHVQKVLVMSPAKLLLANSKLSLGGYDTNYIYGPFGLIGENGQAYILIEWQKDKDGKFVHQSGLFIVPRSDSTYLVPASP